MYLDDLNNLIVKINNKFRNLNGIGSTLWTRHRENISNSIKDILKINKEYETFIQQEKKNSLVPNISNSSLLINLYKIVDNDTKLVFIQENKIDIHQANICPICLDWTPQKSKCLHSDCSGMCESCLKQIENECNVCNKRQTQECPICFDEKSRDELVDSYGCIHKICWKCFGQAYQNGYPINKCALCRKQFNSNYTDKGVLLT